MLLSIDRLIENRRGRTKTITPYIYSGCNRDPAWRRPGSDFPPERSDPDGHPYDPYVAV